MIKQCIWCGREFTTNNGNTKLCSEECKKARAKSRFQHYYETNKEKHNRVCREYNKTHKEECREAVKRFFERNPGKNKEYVQKSIQKISERDNIAPKEVLKRYRENVAKNKGLSSLTELNKWQREKVAANRNMTPKEYDNYIKGRRASTFGLTSSEMYRIEYRAKKENIPLWQLLNCDSYEDYRNKLKGNITTKEDFINKLQR